VLSDAELEREIARSFLRVIGVPDDALPDTVPSLTDPTNPDAPEEPRS